MYVPGAFVSGFAVARLNLHEWLPDRHGHVSLLEEIERLMIEERSVSIATGYATRRQRWHEHVQAFMSDEVGLELRSKTEYKECP